MLVTIIASYDGRTDLRQIEAPTVKDCLVAWAGKVNPEGLSDDARTRLRGKMADFNAQPEALPNVWKLEADLGASAGSRATVVVVETVRS